MTCICSPLKIERVEFLFLCNNLVLEEVEEDIDINEEEDEKKQTFKNIFTGNFQHKKVHAASQ